MKTIKDTEETNYDNYHDQQWQLDETSNIIMEDNKKLIILLKEDKEHYYFLSAANNAHKAWIAVGPRGRT